jgi:F0F1-type ATP synthase delta subunit
MLCQIIRSFNELIQAAKGIIKVTVITAEALKKNQIDTLESAIKGFIGKDKKARVLILFSQCLSSDLTCCFCRWR